MGSSRSSNGPWVLLPVMAALILAGLWLWPRSDSQSDSLVVYCAHDQVYADEIIREFERQTGIHVDVRYDTEATKSLGLINLIVQERRHPRCDVFWNNEMLGTLDLQSRDLLEPYLGTAWERLPEKYRDPQGYWVGFGARLRVIIVNTAQMSTDQKSIQSAVALDSSRAAIAKPLFGTTLTHYTVLWDAWGPERLKAWHYELRLRGIREVNGNGPVKDVVAGGTCGIGLTDTDDVYVAIDDHLPVDMIPVRVRIDSEELTTSAVDAVNQPANDLPSLGFTDAEGTRTICIPNTAAIIRGTRRLDAARKFVDFLASAETELALALSKSRQVPLGPVDASQLPPDVSRMKEWADDSYDLRPLLPARRACLEWLKSEYLK
ncbi:MAG: transporter substrate-binding protein [Schlesneria sp.]|nr:transporter substrate-binding protein [Schlesneria sp.]